MGLWIAIVLVALGGGLLLAGRLAPPQGSQGDDAGKEGDMAKGDGKQASQRSGKQAAFATPSMLAAAAEAEKAAREKAVAPPPRSAPSPTPVAMDRSTAPAIGSAARATPLSSAERVSAAALAPKPGASGERPSGRETSKKERVDVLVEKVKAELDKILRESQSGRPAADE